MNWYLAHLTPQADGCFSDGFYPIPKRGTGTRQVFFALTQDAQNRILLVSGTQENQIRVVTNTLASIILTSPKPEFEKATKKQSMILDSAASKHVLSRWYTDLYESKVIQTRRRKKAKAAALYEISPSTLNK